MVNSKVARVTETNAQECHVFKLFITGFCYIFSQGIASVQGNRKKQRKRSKEFV